MQNYVQLSQFFQIDDPLDAVAVHAGAGCWGLLAAPFFVQGGIFFGGGESALKMLMWNALAGGAVIVWYAVTAIVIFGALMVLRVFRVNEAQEIQGLDVVKHNEPAYPIGISTVFLLNVTHCPRCMCAKKYVLLIIGNKDFLEP